MSVPTPAELLAFLQEHGFLTLPQVQQLRGGSDTKFADARVLARELVDRNWLTPYQANQLLLGRGGDLLVGSYRILDRLGEGGMGQVFKAHHVSMDRLVALKIIAKDRVSNPTAVARFYREVRAVAKLSHPNIVIAFEVNEAGQTPFLAMEYVEGIDLAKLVQQSGPLPIPRACDYIRQTATGLQHAHEKGLVHRDIKPGNLIVARTSPDAPPIIKILDFGLARFESESDPTTRLTQLGRVVGTVDYIAPEQAQNPRTADIRANIYSLGCTLFYLLTGKPPFEGEDTVEKIGARVLGAVPSVRENRPEVSPALECVVAKMTARNPVDRYQTPGEVAKALEPHTQSKRHTPRAALTILDRSVAPPPVAETRVQIVLPSVAETAFASLQPGGERNQRRSVSAAIWIGLAGAVVLGAVALLGILVGVIVLVANHEDSDSKKGTPPTTVAQRKPNDKQDDFRPDRKPVREETDQGKSKKENGSDKQADSKPDGDLLKTQIVELGNGMKMEFVLIPKGKFTMGSPKTEQWHEDREEQHEVEISKPFYLAKYPVTQQQYQALMKENPSFLQAGKVKDQYPVERVSWEDTQAFCQKMRANDKQGRDFRLPTEAEWEYACRGGTKTAYWFGDGPQKLGDYAWFRQNSNGGMQNVGTKKPNPWGLYDMHGNVWQWCADVYGDYPKGAVTDPQGPKEVSGRVIRGGCWNEEPRRCRSAFRGIHVPTDRSIALGFRVCFRLD